MLKIPFSPIFYITEDGRIFDKDGKERNYYFNGDGYRTASILRDDGKWVTYGVHRLIMLTYEPIEDSDMKVVNHIDLDKTNCNRSNLEWVSVKSNNIHAVLFGIKSKRPVVKCSKGDDSFFFYNTESMEDFFGVDIESIWKDISAERKIDGWELSYIPANSPEVRKIINGILGTVEDYRRSIDVLNLHTGKKLSFPSMNKCAEHFNVKITHIRNRISKPELVRIFHGKYIITDAGETMEISDELKEKLLGRGAKKVATLNVLDREFRIFDSASSFIKIKKLSKKAVTVRLKKGKIERVGDFIFSYFTNEHEIHKVLVEMGEVYTSA